jgi:hypothetical protein
MAIGSMPVQSIELRKHTPRIDTSEVTQVKTCKYPAILLLPELCGFTELQNKIIKEKWRINKDNPYNSRKSWVSYQQMIIGGHTLTLIATSHKLYDVIAEAQKIADNKTHNETISKLRQTKEPMTCKMIYNPDSGNDEPHYESNCLFPIDWLKAHYQDVIPEPTIDLVVNGKETHFNGNFRTGCVHEFMVVNAELWERPRIKGKKIKVEVN